MPGFLASLKGLLPTREVTITRAPTNEEIQAKAQETIKGLKEAVGLYGSLQMYLNQYIDPTGMMWFNTNQGGGVFPAGLRDNKAKGRDRYLYWTEEQLNWFRNYCRWISKTVPFAIGIFRHLINFTVKTGYQVEIEGKDGKEVPEELATRMKQRIRDFQKRFEEDSGGVIHWSSWEQMNKRIAHVDGERIWKLTPTPEGMKLRRIEPEQIKNPPGGTEQNGWYFGVKCVPGDALARQGYWITDEPGGLNGAFYDSEYVIHYRRNADDNTARGISDLLPVGDDMLQVDRLMESFRQGATERAKVVAMRVHKEFSGDQIQAMANALKEVELPNPRLGVTTTGLNTQAEVTEPGTYIDCSEWTDVKTMPAGNTEEAIMALDACLRGLCQTWCMAEFIGTSNAQNNNYASSMMAGGPTVRFFEAEQFEDCCQYELLYRKVLRWDALLGEFGFSEEDLDTVEIKVYGPSPVIVDELAQAQKFQIEKQEKARSIADWQRQIGLDPEVMQAEIQDETDLYPQDDPLALVDAKAKATNKMGGNGGGE